MTLLNKVEINQAIKGDYKLKFVNNEKCNIDIIDEQHDDHVAMWTSECMCKHGGSFQECIFLVLREYKQHFTIVRV